MSAWFREAGFDYKATDRQSVTSRYERVSINIERQFHKACRKIMHPIGNKTGRVSGSHRFAID